MGDVSSSAGIQKAPQLHLPAMTNKEVVLWAPSIAGFAAADASVLALQNISGAALLEGVTREDLMSAGMTLGSAMVFMSAVRRLISNCVYLGTYSRICMCCGINLHTC